MTSEIFSVWFLMGAALVFWMQAGFAMVETGFTRAKNAGNILMKNLMDFCIGTGVFILIGFSFLLGEDLLGFIGKPGFDIFTNYANFDWSNFVFNLVFCAKVALHNITDINEELLPYGLIQTVFCIKRFHLCRGKLLVTGERVARKKLHHEECDRDQQEQGNNGIAHAL